MEVLKIRGGNRLEGTVAVDGAKNAVLPIMAAALMVEGEVVLKKVPALSDVAVMCDILSELGAAVRRDGDVLVIRGGSAVNRRVSAAKMQTMRASNLLWAPLLDRFGEAEIPLPGGCRIGARPMDLHIRGLRALGVAVTEEGGWIKSSAHRREGAEICLDLPSVGATENIIMAAVRAKGRTVLRNAAREPEVADLCGFLNRCGADIRGVGGDTLEIIGVPKLCAAEYTIIPDRIVCGTLLPAVLMCGGDVTLTEVCPDHLGALVSKLRDCGAEITAEGGNHLRIRSDGIYGGADLCTMPYPGFPTDMQPPFMAAMTLARGTSVIRESIFENRFRQAGELRKMGADIRIADRVAVVRGMRRLHGAEVAASDLRCGAALVIAALAAEGESIVQGVGFVDRGYSSVEGMFGSLGGDIFRDF